jgi:hypothetical protein
VHWRQPASLAVPSTRETRMVFNDRENLERSYALDVVWNSRRNLPKNVRPGEFESDSEGDSDSMHYVDTDCDNDLW